MEDNHELTIMNFLKLPFVFVFYVLYMLLTIFIPSKYVSRVIKIDSIEANLNYYFTSTLFLKIIALIITIIIFIYFE